MQIDTMRIHDTISYPVRLRATPGCDVDGLGKPGAVMWSADLDITGEGSGLVAHGATATDALNALAALVTERAEPYPMTEEA
jgi:hypothetical protein